MPSAGRALLFTLSSGGVLGARTTPRAPNAAQAIQSIGSLLQNHDGTFSQVMGEIRALASQAYTPGVDDSLQESLSTVVSDIEQNVESKLIAAFVSMQSEVDSAIAGLEASTMSVVEKSATAIDWDNSWFNCVRQEKSMLAGAEAAEEALQSSRSSVTEPCQLQEDRASYANSPLDTPNFHCDISEQGNCDAQVENFRLQVSSMIDGVVSDLRAKQELYNEAKGECDAANADVVEKQSEHDTALVAFEERKEECMRTHETRQLSMCLFGTALQQKCEQVSAYHEILGEIDSSEGLLSLSSLQAEWQTAAVVKCMLSKVIAGIQIDAAALSDCEGTVDFEQQVGQLDRKEAAFDGLVTPDKFTCSESTITFRGQTWEIVGPHSSDYRVEDWSPAVSLAEGSAPFTFCEGGVGQTSVDPV